MTKEYQVHRRYLATLVDSNCPQLIEADYNVRETDDGVITEMLVSGSIVILNKQEEP